MVFALPVHGLHLRGTELGNRLPVLHERLEEVCVPLQLHGDEEAEVDHEVVGRSLVVKHAEQLLRAHRFRVLLLLGGGRMQAVDELHEVVVEVFHGVGVVAEGGQLVLGAGDGGPEARVLRLVGKEAFEVGKAEAPVGDNRNGL